MLVFWLVLLLLGLIFWCPYSHPVTSQSVSRISVKITRLRLKSPTPSIQSPLLIWLPPPHIPPPCCMWCFVMIRMMWFLNYVHKFPYRGVNFLPKFLNALWLMTVHGYVFGTTTILLHWGRRPTDTRTDDGAPLTRTDWLNDVSLLVQLCWAI